MVGAIPKTGPLGIIPIEYDPGFMQHLIARLEQIHILLAQPAQTGYAMSNVTATRILDANLASSSHTITDATTTPVAAGSIGTVTGAALSTSNTYTDSAVNTEINVVVGNVRAAIDAETDVNTALMETAINNVVSAGNTNIEVALDALGADILVLADVVGTLIDDLKAVGVVSK
jgi:hypothetical protein